MLLLFYIVDIPSCEDLNDICKNDGNVFDEMDNIDIKMIIIAIQ